MRKIKFSHDYPKLPEFGGMAKLLQCFLIDRESISKAFEEYDTKYYDGQDKYYPLPKGKVIVLLFLAVDDTVFTTIRRYKPSKYDYYKGSEGHDFKIEIFA